ncbi:hypothetical protein [Nocardioides sp. WS12]|uniref:hypothetical protein n=1 Tax=Nocardioides sp. WS12 TaxID=2486272 RepID=UPI0015F8CE85|nr:hypothetical protein [Nocardioides sp. WS12]
MNGKIPSFLVGTVCLALLASACGSDDSDNPADSSPKSTKSITVAASDVKVADPAAAKTQPLPGESEATGTPIKIGFPYTDWEALKQAGYPLAFRTDDEEQIDALVDWANAHGGIAGHPIDPVPVKVTTVDPNALQAACLKMTQEEKTALVVDVGVFIGNPSCVVQQNNTPMLTTFPGSDSEYLKQFPKLSGGAATLEQAATDLIGGGAEMGFFDIPGKLGILRNGCDPDSVWDGPNGVYALLKQLGITSDDYVEYKNACDFAVTAGKTATQALLAFKAANVTKVIAGTGSAMEKTVSAQGQRQGFQPAWLIGDFASTIQNTTLLNNDNIDGAYGVSGTALTYEGSESAALCDEIFTGAGLPAMKGIDVDLSAAYHCDAVVQMVQIGALMDKDAEVTTESYAEAAQKAGNLFSAQTYGVTYGEGDMLGADKVGLFRYDADKKAWKQQGETIVAPHVPQS